MRHRRNPNIAPRRVDVENNAEDHLCVILAMRGRSNRAINAATDLTGGQISYRLKLYGVKRMEYRDGTSPFAKRVDKATAVLAEQALLQHLRHHIGKG